MPYTTHQWLAQLINIVNVSCNSSMSCSAHQRLESSPTPQDVNIFVLTSDEDVNILHNAPTSRWLTNVLQIQQDVIRQTSVIKGCLSSFRDFPECCRQFGKPHGLPFLVELSCFLVHVRLPVRGTPCRPTSPRCYGTAREASWHLPFLPVLSLVLVHTDHTGQLQLNVWE